MLRLIAAWLAVAVAWGGAGAAQAAATTKPSHKPVTVLSVGAEGADDASVGGTRVWNVRGGYNRVRVTAVSTATFEGYRTWWNSYTGESVRVPIGPTTLDMDRSGRVGLECLRSARDPWYSSRDSSRTVRSNRTTRYRLPLRNAARCRVSVSLSSYTSSGDYAGYDYSGRLTVSDSLVAVRVESIR